VRRRRWRVEPEVKRFQTPDDARSFAKGKFDLISVGGVAVGHASYEPGWKWSEHVGPVAGSDRCEVAHVGLVESGHAKVLMNDGTEIELSPGDVFYIGPGHDSWVVGDEPYVSVHFVGAEQYARGE